MDRQASPPEPAADAKEWATTRARAAIVGLLAFRSDPNDGSPVFFTVVPASPPRMQMHPDLASVRARIEALEADEL